jgi:hypothetical protein
MVILVPSLADLVPLARLASLIQSESSAPRDGKAQPAQVGRLVSLVRAGDSGPRDGRAQLVHLVQAGRLGRSRSPIPN